MHVYFFFFFKQKTAYEMRISDLSSDVCSSDLILPHIGISEDLMTRILIWGLFGLGFDLLFGYTGLLSFGQAAFYGTGGFVTAYLLTTGVVSMLGALLQIGRASCRERVGQYV